MPKLPIIRFDPADIESSLPDVAARISYKSATFLSSHRQPGLKNQLSGEMRRSSRLLAAAEKGEDNASLTRKAATQAVMEWINTMDTIAKAEKVLRDLTPVLAGSNDELFEKIISRQDWYSQFDICCKSLVTLTPHRLLQSIWVMMAQPSKRRSSHRHFEKAPSQTLRRLGRGCASNLQTLYQDRRSTDTRRNLSTFFMKRSPFSSCRLTRLIGVVRLTSSTLSYSCWECSPSAICAAFGIKSIRSCYRLAPR